MENYVVMVLEGDQRNMKKINADDVIVMVKSNYFQGIVSNFEDGIVRTAPLSFKNGSKEHLLAQNEVLTDSLVNKYSEEIDVKVFTLFVLDVLSGDEISDGESKFDVVFGAVGNSFLVSAGTINKDNFNEFDISCYMYGAKDDLIMLNNALKEFLSQNS